MVHSDSDSATTCSSCENGPIPIGEPEPFMYGVEVEFQAAIRHEEAPVSYQMGERSYWIREILKQRLVDEFQREDIPASIEQGEEDEPTTSGRPDRDPKFPGHRRVRTKYLRWQIKNEVKDPPVATYDKDDNPSGYYFLAMELASRAFFAGSREAEQEIREVFALVRAEFDTTLFHCGMHVHLSAQNLTLEQQKRLITLVWIMERRLFALCAPARYRTMELQPISEESTPAVLAASGRLPRLDQSKQWVQEMRRNLPSSMAGSSDEEQLAMFWKVDSMRALKNLLMKPEIGGHGARNALNIKGKCHGDKLGSFEFRYPESTLDPKLVKYWVEWVVTMGRLAQRPAAEFQERLTKLSSHNLSVSWYRQWFGDYRGAVYLVFKEFGIDDDRTLQFWQDHARKLARPGETLPARQVQPHQVDSVIVKKFIE